MSTDSPDVVVGKRLIDDLKVRGFQFGRTAPGPDGPLVGNRVTDRWVDTVYIDGFSSDCIVWRQRRTSLVVPSRGLIERRVAGGALIVLSEVATWETES